MASSRPIYPHPFDGNLASQRIPSKQLKDIAEWARENANLLVGFLRGGDVEFFYRELGGYREYVEGLKGTEFEGIEPGVDAVWKMDGVLGEALRGGLKDAVSTLKTTPNKERGWPAAKPIDPSKQQYRDLLNPYMYPILYNLTTSLENGEFNLISVRPPYKTGQDRMGCWLPSEFKISENGNCKISSYINNLTLPGQDVLFHPIFERVFMKMVPLFDHALADLAGKGWQRKRCGKAVGFTMEGDYYSDDEDGMPGPAEKAWTPPKIVTGRMLRGKTVKVVVRMEEVKLVPQDPLYRDDSRHVDGMANERIVATGVYLYDQENVTTPSIAFKRRNYNFAQDEFERFPSDGNMYYTDAAGIAPSRRDVGTTLMKENRAIVFPNLYEQNICPFQLKDKKKPGFIKLLYFHLCDPAHETTRKLPTTRTVPPQQPGQFEKILRDTKQLGKLPESAFQSILGYCIGNVITVEKAKMCADKMDEKMWAVMERGF
ncbi:hypothetical protein TWF481_001839 [Arthrobotrys musiformis]|uniref:DUF4246 domain-containing protein n=1 Tax=Arthrobotrys musiformis TaxID=47236 RepID=A0AAV9W0I7_9PEZI